ncbi:MAG: hypothetical protein FWF29_01425 [Treponema sp.]|nr:hypothetical protein [Treponema sp.]
MRRKKFTAQTAVSAFLAVCALVLFAGCPGSTDTGTITPPADGPWIIYVTQATGGTITISPNNEDYALGDEVTVTASPGGNYVVESISVTAKKDNAVVEGTQSTDDVRLKFTFNMPADDVTVTAVYKQVKFNISVTTNNAGTIDVTGGNIQKAGDAVSFTATEATTYIFDDAKVSISDNVSDLAYTSGNTFTFTMPEGNVLITLNFEQQVADADHGFYELGIRGGTWAYQKPLWQSKYAFTPGKYQFEVWAKGTMCITFGLTYKTWYDDGYYGEWWKTLGDVDSRTYAVYDDWTRVTETFDTTQTCDRIVISQECSTNANPPWPGDNGAAQGHVFGHLDNLAIYKVDSSGNKISDNLILDGDFEQGNIFGAAQADYGPWYLETDADEAFKVVPAGTVFANDNWWSF